MLLFKPDYYDCFRCAAGECPDSCCKEWEVEIDDASARFYRTLPGTLGDRLREVMRTADGKTSMSIIDGRCPMWRSDGLCRIQAELGESALCETCRMFPRLTHDYGDFAELGLELSCPEAAKLILNAPLAPLMVDTRPDGGTPGYDVEAMASLKASREVMLSILSDESHSVGESGAGAALRLSGAVRAGRRGGKPLRRRGGAGNRRGSGKAGKSSRCSGFLSGP